MLQDSLANPRSQKQKSTLISLGDDNLQTLIFNNSEESKTLKGQLGALQSQVLLMFFYGQFDWAPPKTIVFELVLVNIFYVHVVI